MRFVNYGGRAHLFRPDGGAGTVLDIHAASGGRWPAAPERIFEDWPGLLEWASNLEEHAGAPVDESLLGPPSPQPRQVFAIGLNYAAHAAESGVEPPPVPSTFTKFAVSLVGPYGEIVLPSANVDWEVELVVVIGVLTTGVRREDAWHHVAGLTLGQDLSERVVQLTPPAPQFSLGKSFPGFGPTGPALVTPDEFADPNDLELGCSVNGAEMQRSSSIDMIFPVPRIVEYLSSIVTLYPGDVIFTGTPPGVGMGRKPPRYLAPGDELTSFATGIGTMRHRLVAASSEPAGWTSAAYRASLSGA